MQLCWIFAVVIVADLVAVVATFVAVVVDELFFVPCFGHLLNKDTSKN